MIPLLALLYAIASFAGGSLSFFLLLFPVGIDIGGIEIIFELGGGPYRAQDRPSHHEPRACVLEFWLFSSGIISALVARSGLSPQIHCSSWCRW
jgi:hypothetical protein